MKIKHYEADGAEQTSHKAFCSKHRPVSLSAGASKMVDKSESEPEDTDTEWEAENSANENALLKERTSSLKKRNIFSSSTVVAPIQLLDRIDSSLGDERVMIKHRREFLTLLLKYWSIKRQFRRGAPLLKRLHLEVCFIFLSGS
jgi:NuA3 HAT complex component NTO1